MPSINADSHPGSDVKDTHTEVETVPSEIPEQQTDDKQILETEVAEEYEHQNSKVKRRRSPARVLIASIAIIVLVLVASGGTLLLRAQLSQPDFIRILKSGVYGYDYQLTLESGGQILKDKCHVQTDGKSSVIVSFNERNGRILPLIRLIYYSEDKMIYTVYDDVMEYSKAFFTEAFKLPGQYYQIDSVGKGISMLYGERLEYLDYIMNGHATRCFLKDGDVYAMQYLYGDTFIETRYITQVYKDSPPDYYTIPANYVDMN